jgi:hypothetical protein
MLEESPVDDAICYVYPPYRGKIHFLAFPGDAP